MFFGRFGQKPSVESFSRTAKQTRRRRLAIVSVAVAVTIPAGVVEIARLYAQDVQPQSAQDLLKQGQSQLSDHQYEEALASLKQIQRDSLSGADQKALDSALDQAQKGADGRKAARDEFQAGETSLAAGNPADAISHYRNAASNNYADQGTHQKALEKIALAESEEKNAAATDSRMYKEAVADYKAGRYDSAREKFQQLQSHDYHAPLFQSSPSSYLHDIDKHAPKAAEAAPSEAPAAPATAPAESSAAPAAPETPATPATPPAAENQTATAQPTETTPPPVAATPAAPEEAQATTQPAAPAPAEASATPEAPTPPSAPAAPSAKELYQRGRKEYRSGDWIAARRDLTAAREMGYRQGLFEEAPASILAKMDKKEAADAQREMTEAERKQAQENATAQNTPTTAPAESTPTETAAAPTTAPAEEVTATPTTPPPSDQSQTNNTPTAAATPAPAPSEQANATPAPAEQSPAATVPTLAESQNSAPVVQPTSQPAAMAPSSAAQQALTDTAKLDQIRAQERAYEASQLVDQARTAENENRLADALSLYTRAAELDPNNQAAVTGRAHIQVLTGRTPVPSSLMQQQETIINERRQSIQYSFKSAIQNANDAIAAHNFATAETALANARAARDQDPTIFSPEEIRGFNAQISSTEQTLITTRNQAAIEERTRAQAEAEAQQRHQMEEAAVSRQNTIEDLIKAARRSIEEGKYEEAINILNQILTLDPNNDYALGVKPLVQDKVIILQQRSYREQFNAHLLGQLNNAEEEKIPYDDIFRYPDNWPEIRGERDAEVAESQGIDTEDRAVNQILDHQIPPTRFDGQPFGDVIESFRHITGANIEVKWNALEAVAVDKTTPVTETFNSPVAFRTALKTVLGDLGSANAKIGYKVSDGMITISTADDLQGTPIPRVYDISDLLVQHEDFTQIPFIDIANQTTATVGGGSTQSPIQSAGQPNPQEITEQRQKTTQSIIQAIHDSISDGSWRDTGNGQGTITQVYGQNQLIVAQSEENHDKIAKILSLMRENQGLQVNIEARFLTVSKNFLDAVGLNLGFVFNTQNPAQVQTVNGVPQHVPGTGNWAPIQVTAANSSFTNGVGVQNGLSLNGLNAPQGAQVGPFGSLSLVPGQGGPQYAAAYLSDFQVDLLLEATQASETNTVVTAPRVTVFNGQEAYIAVLHQQAYVGNLTAVTAAGVAAFQPVPAIASTGAILYVRPTVTADRKYVTMSLRPQTNGNLVLNSFQFQTGVASTGGINGGGGATPTALIQLPTFDTTDLRTIVSVPDGGTLLLGGQTVAAEDVREEGTPVLSKIPFLKRLFTNRATAKGEDILLILVKPTILVQREQEGRQFPLLSQKVGP